MLDTGCGPPARRAYASESCSMFIDATEGVMQFIEYRVSRIQRRSFDGTYFASNGNADLIEFMQRWGKLHP